MLCIQHGVILLVSLLLVGLVSLAYAEEVTVTGQVLGPDGRPVAEAQVLVQYNVLVDGFNGKTPIQRRRAVTVQIQRTVTGADGTFSLRCDFTHLFNPVTLAAYKPGLGIDWTAFYPREQVTATLSLGGNPITLIGTVRDPEGNPIARAEAYVHSLWRGEQGMMRAASDSISPLRTCFRPQDKSFLSATTDDVGQFEIPGLPPDGQVSLTVLAAGRERWSTGFEWLAAATQDLEVVLQAEAMISGHITHQGQPVGGRTVFCTTRLFIARKLEYLYANRGLHAATTVSGEDGTYRFAQLSPGIHYVRVDVPEGLTGPTIGPITLGPGESATDADVVLTPGGLVKGTITETDTGQPLAGITVNVTSANRASHPQTDDDGNYVVRLLPGQYEISCTPSYDVAVPVVEPQRHRVEAVEGETITGVDFVVYPLSMYGQVLLPDGRAAAGVKVGALGVRYLDGKSAADASEFNDLFRAETDAQGYFELKFKERRGFWVSILACHFELGLAGLLAFEEDVLPDGPVEIRLTPGGYLHTEVVDPADRPLPDIASAISLPQGLHGSQTIAGPRTDEGGHLTIGPLPAGVSLRVRPAPGVRPFVTGTPWWDEGDIVLAPGEQRDLPPLVVNLQGRSLKGWVGDEHQQPVKGALVFAPQIEEPIVADESGYFELTGLPVRGKLLIVGVHLTEPLVAAEEIDPDWGLRANLVLRPLGTATGQIVDKEGRPLSGVNINLHRPVPGSGGGLGRARLRLQERLGKNSFRRQTVTDWQGRWSVGCLIEGGGEYQLTVWAPGARGGREQTTFTATGGETVDLGTIVLED